MIGLLPTPLDESFRDVLVEVARAHKWPTVTEPQRLSPLVAALAAAYNDPQLRGLVGVDHRAARLGFSLPRDIPKVAGAVREMIAIGRLRLTPDRPLRVLDVGAGLGASHRGLARALDAASMSGTLEVLALDSDPSALELVGELAKHRPREGNVALSLRTDRFDATKQGSFRPGRFDVILLGQVLSELDLDRTGDERVEAHRASIASLVRERLERDGVLVVVEPSLRLRSRHLQRVRGALLSAGDARVMAPCLHAERCPLLGREGDWCHEDLAVDLPKWLVPVAKGAGLRWEGLTFSYLVLSREGPTLRDAIVREGKVERVVSAAMPTKGKLEVILCGDRARGEVSGEGDVLGPHGVRLGRLDRARSPENSALDTIGRGDVIALRGALDDKHRVQRGDEVARVDLPPPTT